MDLLVARIVAWRYFSVWKFLGKTFEVLGAMWVLIEIATALFWANLAGQMQPFRWWVLGGAALTGLIRSRPRTSVSARIKGTDVTVSICVGDLFAQRGALVIGSNTTFDTSIEDGTISPQSVQGQVTRRLFASRDQLDRELEAALKDVPCEERSATDKPYGKCATYPVGTVARVRCKDGRAAYFVAIATMNRTRAAQSTRQDVLDALPKLWEHVRSNGEVGPLLTPVLGSGFSRLRAPRQELVCETVRSFVAANRDGKFCDELTIALAPGDFLKGRYDLQELGRFLAHECEYSSAAAEAPVAPVGTPLP